MKPELVDGFIVVGDLAYLPNEWERLKKRRTMTPEYRARKAEDFRRWVEAKRDHVNAYKREWTWNQRHPNQPRPVGYLHDLACTGSTRRTGCVCKKIPCYSARERAA